MLRVPFPCRLVPAITFAAIFMGAAVDLSAQPTRAITTVDRRIETMNRQAKDYERDDMTRDPARKNNAEAAKRSRQIRLEIEEDLNALQNLYNTIVTGLHGSSPLTGGFASDAARMARKHASRLKTNLALPTSEEKDEKAATAEPSATERESLKILCKVIYDFITNPMFEGAGSIDVKNGTKASRDLDAIMRLTERVSADAETGVK